MRPIKIYRSGIHLGEERIIVGNHKSGMINFSGCHLACNFCYTPETSVEDGGEKTTPTELYYLMDDLIKRGAKNLNLISPTHVWPMVERPIKYVLKKYGRRVPLVLKTSGYESTEQIRTFAKIASVMVPDFKVWTPEAAKSVNLPSRYGEYTLQSIALANDLLPIKRDRKTGQLTQGLLIRHLMMPGYLEESLSIIRMLQTIRYRGFLNIMTYFIDPQSQQLLNANPDELDLLQKVGQQSGFKILVNGQSPLPQPSHGRRIAYATAT